jgi:YD repeat-containing protein
MKNVMVNPLRISTVTLDETCRAVTWTAPGVAATQVTYDGRGRPTRVQRWLDVTCGPNGLADTLTDALARTSPTSSVRGWLLRP